MAKTSVALSGRAAHPLAGDVAAADAPIDRTLLLVRDLASTAATLQDARRELSAAIAQAQYELDRIDKHLDRILPATAGFGAAAPFSPVSGDTLRDVLAALPLAARRPYVTSALVAACVAHVYGLRFHELTRTRRRLASDVSEPSAIAYMLSCELTGESYATIVATFGRRNHTTAIYHEKRAKQRAALDPTFRARVEEIRTLCVSLSDTIRESEHQAPLPALLTQEDRHR